MDLYQDALHPDRVDRGERDCLPRWELIRPHMPTTGMILDVGSNLGYYCLKASGETVSVAVVSMEPEPSTAERQRRLLKEHGTSLICLIQGAVDAALAAQWAVSLMHLGRLLYPQRAYWIQGAAAAVESWPEHGDPLPHNMLWTRRACHSCTVTTNMWNPR
jgi:hypothetical protein